MAAPSSKTRRHTLKPDSKGRYRPRIGVILCDDGEYRARRFNLGTDRKKAEARYAAIQALYEDEVRSSGGEGWVVASLEMAEQIARGEPITVPPPPPTQIFSKNSVITWGPSGPDDYAQVVELDRQRYPSVDILPSNIELYGRGVVQNEVQIQERMRELQEELQALGMLRSGESLPDHPIVGTFYEALDEYEKYVRMKPDGISDTTMHQRLSQTKQLRMAHDDRPLATLGLNACREIFGYWTSRPKMPNSEKFYGRDTCKHRLSELSMFFKWLHSETSFGWRKPIDFETIGKKIRRDESRRSIRELVGVRTFDLNQLALLNRHCDTLDRLLLFLGLNCGFGAAESGRLDAEDIFINEENPLGHLWRKYGFTSSPSDSWIALLRNKTGVAGCWWLWPETVDAINQWRQERPQAETQRIIVTEVGTSLYRDHSKNAQSGFANRWRRLLSRVNEGKVKVPNLPFGTLRDQFSDWATYEGFSEEASIGLAHGKPFKDNLQECYANRPFPRLFELQKQYREFLKPVLEVAHPVG